MTGKLEHREGKGANYRHSHHRVSRRQSGPLETLLEKRPNSKDKESGFDASTFLTACVATSILYVVAHGKTYESFIRFNPFANPETRVEKVERVTEDFKKRLKGSISSLKEGTELIVEDEHGSYKVLVPGKILSHNSYQQGDMVVLDITYDIAGVVHRRIYRNGNLSEDVIIGDVLTEESPRVIQSPKE